MKYKNIKISDYFLDNSIYQFKLRHLLISLKRTYVFNIMNDNTIYYRKNINYRKIYLFGIPRNILLPNRVIFSKNKYNNYVKDISKIISEYINTDSRDNYNYFDFDIAKKYNNRKIVTMDFNEKDNNNFNNIFWIDSKNIYNMSKFDI